MPTHWVNAAALQCYCPAPEERVSAGTQKRRLREGDSGKSLLQSAHGHQLGQLWLLKHRLASAAGPQQRCGGEQG